jgi:hypothetical protein
MATITDEQMRAMLTRAREYTIVILRPGPNHYMDGVDAIVWEHGRRNFELRDAEVLAIVCPVRDGSDVCGVGVFNLDPDRTCAVMEEDPGVSAGVFVYEVHPCRGFPGDTLPG